jgi:hypothetical protein
MAFLKNEILQFPRFESRVKKLLFIFLVCEAAEQGCQIFLGTKYQNWEITKIAKLPLNYKNVLKMYQKAVKYTKWP